MTSRPSLRLSVAAIFALQLGLLAIGITRDYRLKHEDNNALHATFARAHLQLGFETTKGQNYFHNPATGSGVFYANHPPGPGLVLAAAYYLTGNDGPLITRATAAAFHVFAALLFVLWLAAGAGYVACFSLNAAVEILVTVGVTLSQRHLNPEAYCIETVEALRRAAL